MTKDELYNMAARISHDVVEKNNDLINSQIDAMMTREDGSRLSITDAVAAAAAMSITLAPDISAAVTARMLVELGLVSLEDAE